MEEETITVLSIFAIILSLIGIIGFAAIYTSIPEAETNPVTWGAIDQYNARITVIQDDVEDLENDIKIMDFEINNLDYNIDDDDLEDLEDYANDFDDINKNKDNIKDIISCLIDEFTNKSQLQDCLD